ncbi:amino acid adenylation domain-containing protein [Paenibacillus methanolicus]|uniref:Amino acid adenylation domain-containing protein/thioester reductase-like protein n=1 Tax=Paenibacillus methanolicus TaxID=582686 RepID=A0A5S5C7S8_9BACL|nr:amino acid adenylation domain-containing protein [Paenibacillus methanolicus]TYP75461.1 amino acid adenylation domain-containing protein/thioester reductase-like protein [Paenibacillus methanolicus]
MKPTSAAAPTSQEDAPVLNIPLDMPPHARQYGFAEAAYVPSEPVMARASERFKGADTLAGMAAAVYAALMYRLSGGEEELNMGIALHGELVPLQLDLVGEGHTFDSLRSAVVAGIQAGTPEAARAFATTFRLNAEGASALPHANEVLRAELRLEPSAWSVVFRYDESLLTPRSADRYIGMYERLLLAALENPSAVIGSVDLLSAEEHALYERFNATAADYARGATIHQAFERMSEAFGPRTAIFTDEERYTYASLNERANQVARLLLNSGLRKGEFVTIFMERGLSTIVSLLGVLKAGGVYVPVDPEHPEDRIRYIIGDTASPYVLTNARYAAKARALCETLPSVKAIVPVDNGELARLAADNVDAGVLPEDLAYVIYTSGSTGKPKGVLIAHEGVVNLGAMIGREFAITEADILTQFATFSFDASVWETFGALLNGAALYLLGAEERISVEAFALAVERTQASVIIVLPTVFFNEVAAHLSEEGFARLASIRSIMTAGEALYGEQVRILQRRLSPNVGIYNLYGPTECTVCATMYRIDGPVAEDVTHIPIGTPISNYQVYVVGPDQSLCPVNVPGELYISTVGIARGYLNQPDKTAAAFVANPFAEGEVAYRSGDIVKLRADGQLEYVGRRDAQVKIRGHRIEIGAIEDTLAKHPEVHTAAVIARKEPSGQTMLVGYYTSKDGEPIAAAKLAALLHESLPPYYVPKKLVQLAAMPLSPSGKVERKLLAGYPIAEEEPEQAGARLLLTPTQSRIANAWRGVLGVKRVEPDTNFFEAGGDSLDIIHVLVQLKPDYPQLVIGDLFQYETLAALAAYAEESGSNAVQQLSQTSGVQSYERLRELPVNHAGLAPRSVLAAPVPENILLTGATGYLGSHLLYDLLTGSDTTIIALVRGATHQAATERLNDVMTMYFGPSVLWLMNGRVHVVESDLEQPGLGLSPVEMRLLPRQIDAIIHAAADVRHFGDARKFERTNVASTVELLKLLDAPHRIHFHYVSTISVPESLAQSGQWEQVAAENKLARELRVDNVYSSSKLEAEKLVMAAGERGLPVTIHRPGNLTCHSGTGRFQRNIESNAFYQLIKAMLLLGKAPMADWHVDFTPIDFASSAIARLALMPETEGQVFHIVNPHQILYADLVQMIRDCGYPVELMSMQAYTEWLLDASMPKDPEGLRIAMSQLGGDGAQDSPLVYDCANASAFLEETAIACPRIDQAFIKRMIDHAVSIGYFPPVREAVAQLS